MSDVLKAAEGCLRRGWSVLPLRPRDKRPDGSVLPADAEGHPTWKPFQKKRTTKKQLESWFPPGTDRNIGIVLGKVSNLTELDIDRPEAFPFLFGTSVDELAESTPVCFTGRRKAPEWAPRLNRGVKVLLEGVVKPFKIVRMHPADSKAKPKGLIEVRSEGQQFAAPPSVHPDGLTYTWVRPPPETMLPADDRKIRLLLRPWLVAESLLPFYQEGSRHDLLKSVAAHLRKKWGWPQEETEKVLERVGTVLGLPAGEVRSRVRETYRKKIEEISMVGFLEHVWGKGGAGQAQELERRLDEVLDQLEPKGTQPPRPFGSGAESQRAGDLQAELDTIRSLVETPPFKKLRKAEDAVSGALTDLGRFYRTPGENLYWFRESTKTLHELPDRIQDGGSFVRILSGLSSVNPEDPWMKRLYAYLRVWGLETAGQARVHRLAHWDAEVGVLYVDRFNGTVYRLDGSQIQVVPNGGEGVLFLPEPQTEPFEADFDADEDLFRGKVVGLLQVDETRSLTQDEAEEVVETWVEALYFRSTQPTCPILAPYGPKGTTKTTSARAIGRTLLGPDFDVTALTRHKEDAFQARVTQAGFAVFDNADGKIVWLPDALATLATGGRVDRRKLFRTIELVSYAIQAWAIITARDPRFGRDDVAERLIPLPTARPKHFRREGEIQAELTRLRPQLWGSLLKRLQVCVRRLRENGMNFDTDFRMADFAAFFLAIQENKKGRVRVRALLKKLTELQNEFIAETVTDLWFSYLLEILKDGPMLKVTAGEVVKEIAARAKADNVPIKLSARIVGTTLKNAGPNLRAVGLSVSHRLLRGRRVYDLSLEDHEGKKTPSELVIHQIRGATEDWATPGEIAAEAGKDVETVEKWLEHLRENGQVQERDGGWKWIGR